MRISHQLMAGGKEMSPDETDGEISKCLSLFLVSMFLKCKLYLNVIINEN